MSFKQASVVLEESTRAPPTADIVSVEAAECPYFQIDGRRGVAVVRPQASVPYVRAGLPPGPEKLLGKAARRFFDVKRRVDRGEASWGALTKALEREMDNLIRISSFFG